MNENQSSYRQIMKATSLFGGVQFFQILIQIVKSKIIAILLGTNGVGILGLLNATIELISRIANFGLSMSGVKEIAGANSSENTGQIAVTATIIRRLVWITGLFGTISMLILSRWLSEITFGNTDYTLAFIWISITLLINQLSAGQLLVLQGMRKLRYLANANMLGTFLGLIFTVPLYFFWGIDGIVPGIIITSVITMLISLVYSRKVKIEKVQIDSKTALQESKRILFMGFMLSLSGLVSQGANYGIRIFISHFGGIDQVGLYTAGFVIINSYVGLVFSAMATDYYPRLSAVAESNQQCKNIINQQAEIAILILSPILNLFIIFINALILLLYSHNFLPMKEMMIWAAMGMFFKAASWSISFIMIAKGRTKLFFLNELVTNSYLLGLSVLFYHWWGLKGVGIAFLISYAIYLVQLGLLSKSKFDFSFNGSFILIFFKHLIIAGVSIIAVIFLPSHFHLIIGIPMVALSAFLSYKDLDRRINLKNLIQGYLQNRRKPEV